jgi:hypothetical protein
MTDDPKDAADETPLERALRIKKAALQTRPKPPGGGKFTPRQGAGVSAGASKPATRK